MGVNEVSTASICIVVLLCRTSRGNLRITIFGDSEDFPLLPRFQRIAVCVSVGVITTPRTLRRTRVV